VASGRDGVRVHAGGEGDGLGASEPGPEEDELVAGRDVAEDRHGPVGPVLLDAEKTQAARRLRVGPQRVIEVEDGPRREDREEPLELGSAVGEARQRRPGENDRVVARRGEDLEQPPHERQERQRLAARRAQAGEHVELPGRRGGGDPGSHAAPPEPHRPGGHAVARARVLGRIVGEEEDVPGRSRRARMAAEPREARQPPHEGEPGHEEETAGDEGRPVEPASESATSLHEGRLAGCPHEVMRDVGRGSEVASLKAQAASRRPLIGPSRHRIRTPWIPRRSAPTPSASSARNPSTASWRLLRRISPTRGRGRPSGSPPRAVRPSSGSPRRRACRLWRAWPTRPSGHGSSTASRTTSSRRSSSSPGPSWRFPTRRRRSGGACCGSSARSRSTSASTSRGSRLTGPRSGTTRSAGTSGARSTP
jgi:hypothetical protein